MTVAPIHATDRPAWVKAGVTHLEFVLNEAAKAFRNNQREVGTINLAHAVVVAATKDEGVSEERIKELFREVTDAAGCWE